MKIDQLLAEIEAVASLNGINKPFMVGGVVRDRIIGVRDDVTKINDIDLTTGRKDAIVLAKLVGEKFNIYPRTYDDGHASLDIMGIHIDFSSNFIVPNIDAELKKNGIVTDDPMKKELYSRDFTINTLLESLDFTAIYDLTGEAIKDIKAKIIKCPIDPNITIGTDPRRILRAIRFAIKYDFAIDDKLRQAMMLNRENIKSLPEKFVRDKVSEIVRLDPDKGIDYLLDYKLLPIVPLSKSVYDILIQKRKLIKAL